MKISHSEVEVKFSQEATFTQFKRLLLFRYPTLIWSKYSQRDSARIQVCLSPIDQPVAVGISVVQCFVLYSNDLLQIVT